MFGSVFDVEEYLANEPLSTEADLPFDYEWGSNNEIEIPVSDEKDLMLAGAMGVVGVGLLAFSLIKN